MEEQQQETAGQSCGTAPGERRSAIIVRGIALPAHQVRAAIKQAVARGQVSEEDGEEVFWLYNYAQEYRLKEADLAEKMGAYDQNTIYRVFRGSYGVGTGGGKPASWANFIKAVRNFKAVELEEMKKKRIGIIETEVKKTVFQACTAALNDGMPAFIYGASQIGKTTALMEFQRFNNHGKTVYLRMGSGWTRARFVRELESRGWDVIPSESNFVFARPPAPAKAAVLFESLRSRNIFVRYFPGPKTGDRLRITIGTDGQMRSLLAAMDDRFRR